KSMDPDHTNPLGSQAAPPRPARNRPARNRKVNANDVARMAQVSRSAVSRTFTPGASVAPETRARILAAAATLGYKPAHKGAETAASATRRAGVVMANLYSPYFAHLYSMIEAEMAERGFTVVWRIVSDMARLDATIEDLLDENLQGMIVLSGIPGAQVRRRAKAANVSLVVLERSDTLDGAALVWVDAPNAGRDVARLMLDEGRRRPAAIATNPNRGTELHAFAEMMETAGSDPVRWVETGWNYEHGVSAAEQLLAGPNPPDAVFAASDALAIAIIDVARERYGLRVPEDLSVVGFGDTSQARWLSHPVTSVHIPVMSMVQTAVAIMEARIGPSTTPPPRIWLACDVIERGSTLKGKAEAERAD
ncbi:MAG TPA: LacI family DNA-binding transcriptional regulator, partial [Novosphingobium sp.]|nr:LacI family DNA-binding transcriptional regulator [Novosphingobium sp.]